MQPVTIHFKNRRKNGIDLAWPFHIGTALFSMTDFATIRTKTLPRRFIPVLVAFGRAFVRSIISIEATN